jgi:hypothetical protein
VLTSNANLVSCKISKSTASASAEIVGMMLAIEIANIERVGKFTFFFYYQLEFTLNED